MADQKFVKLEDQTTPDPPPSFSSFSYPSPPSFLVPSPSLSPSPAPLVYPSHPLPPHVSLSLLKVLGRDILPSQEHVIYSVPPSKSNGFKHPCFAFLISLIVVVTIGICASGKSGSDNNRHNNGHYDYKHHNNDNHGDNNDNHNNSFNDHGQFWWGLGFFILSLLFTVWKMRFQFFAYRVVTNHRAALVIPKRHLFFLIQPAAQSVYFQPTMEKLLNGELKENRCTPATKMAAVFYEEEGSNKGHAIVYGQNSLDFGFVPDLKLLDAALAEVIQATARYLGVRVGTQIQVREEGSNTSSKHVRRVELFLRFFLPLSLLDVIICMFILGGFHVISIRVGIIVGGLSLLGIPTSFAIGRRMRRVRVALENKLGFVLGSISSVVPLSSVA